MFDFMKEILDKFLNILTALLPVSPFAGIIDNLEALPYLGYINWFIPVGEMVSIAVTWVTAIGIYYLYSVIARWVKLIS